MPGASTPTLNDSGGDGWLAVAAGLSHTCAIAADSSAYCWGSNEFGQLGMTDTTRCARLDRLIPCETRPRAAAAGIKVLQVAAGGSHTCGIGADGRVYCWGDNLYGQLGDPAIRQSATPTAALAAGLFTAVAAGGSFTCALRSDGVVLCWGANATGQNGSAVVGPGSAIPVAVQSSQRFASIAAGDRRACGRVPDGTLYCWGAEWVGRSAQGTEVTRAIAQPTRVLLSPSFQSITVGTHTTCGIAADASYCWEANPTGTLGDGTTVGATSPIKVKTSERFVSISAGDTQTCGIAATGLAWCWGAAEAGQLGVSPGTISARCGMSSLPCRTSPYRVSGWRLFKQISAGQGDHTCALTLAGNVYCWGAGNMGQRGDGRMSAQWTPTKVATP